MALLFYSLYIRKLLDVFMRRPRRGWVNNGDCFAAGKCYIDGVLYTIAI